MPDKLYVVTRRDLSPGAQATQSTHAAFAFALQHPLITQRWFRDSTFLVLVSTADEASLTALAERAHTAGLAVCCWREPDWADALTAVAIEPLPAARSLLANLPLTLRESAMA